MPRLLLDITPLRESPQFRRLWIGTTLSAVGASLTSFAVTLQIYDLTRSPFAVGLIGLAQLIPLLTVGAFGGPLLDSGDRRKVMFVTSCGLAAVSALFAVQAYTDPRELWLLYTLAAVQAGLNALSRPLRSTYVPALLPPAQLAGGLALNTMTSSIMLIIGPALAGTITAAPHLGLRGCYLIDTLTFTAALYGIARLPAAPAASGASQGGLRAVAEGFAFIRRHQVLACAFLADLNVSVFAFPVVLFPAINAERFGGNPRTLGLFLASFGVGTMVTMSFSGPVRHIVRQGRAMLCTVAVTGAAFAAFALVRGLWPTLGALAVAGAADALTIVFRSTIVATVTPEHIRGRVMATDFMVAAGGTQVGNLESGALGSLTSPVVSAFAGGLVTVAGTIVFGLALPALTRYRHLPAGSAGEGEAPVPVAEAAGLRTMHAVTLSRTHLDRHRNITQKNECTTSVTVPSSATTGSTRHLSSVVHGWDIPRRTTSPGTSGVSASSRRKACWSFSAMTSPGTLSGTGRPASEPASRRPKPSSARHGSGLDSTWAQSSIAGRSSGAPATPRACGPRDAYSPLS
jgi:MFS family permease